MKAIQYGVFCLCILLASSFSVEGGVLSSLVTFDGVPEYVKDDSFGNFTGNLGAPRAGDLMYGVFKINDYWSYASQRFSNIQHSLWGIYMLKVESYDNDNNLVFFEPTGDFLSQALTNLGLTTPSTLRVDINDLSKATLLIVENAANYNLPGFNQDLWSTLNEAADGDPDKMGLDGWSLQMVLGIDGGQDAHIVDLVRAQYNVAYSVLADNFSPAVIYLPQWSWVGGGITGQAFTSLMSDFVAMGSNTISIPSDPNVLLGWAFTDNGNFAFNPVPEPASMIGLASLALAGAGLGFVRRRKA